MTSTEHGARSTRTRTYCSVLLALAVFAICIATLRPAGDSLPEGWSFELASGDEALAESIQNLLLFVPFGVAWALLKAGSWRQHLVLGAALSFTVEFLQQWIPGRDPSLGDIVNNAASTLIGGALVWTAPRWLHAPDARAPWMSLGAAAALAAAWLATGWLFQPAFPNSTYYDRWTPDLPKWPNYKGRIEWATLGTRVLAEGPIPGGEQSLAAGAPLRVHVSAGRPPSERAPILTINDEEHHEILIVGQDRYDPLIVYRTRAARLRLSRPDLRARHALAAVHPGDTVTIAVQRETSGRGGGSYCINTACGLGYTIGDGWKLIFFPDHFPPWAYELLNAMWVGGGLLGVGLWARPHRASGAALLLAALGLAFGPRLVGLNPTPLGEWLGAAGGLVTGHLAWRGRNRLSSLRAPALSEG